jgi:hypothetical protein
LKMTTRSISAGDSRLVDEGKMPNKSLQLSPGRPSGGVNAVWQCRVVLV